MYTVRNPKEIRADHELVEQLLARLQKELRISEKKGHSNDQYKYKKSTNFIKGKLVYITNTITVPSDTIANKNDCFSTVRKVVDNTVFITTQNGLKTWRKSKNLQKVIKVLPDCGSNQRSHYFQLDFIKSTKLYDIQQCAY